VREYWLKNDKLFSKHDGPLYLLNLKALTRFLQNMMFHNTENTETSHGNTPQILFVARTTTPKSLKEAVFVILLHKLAFIVSRVDWCAWIKTNLPISPLEKESTTGSTLSHEQSMEHSNQWNSN